MVVVTDGIVYPPSRTVDQVDDYHGTPVADPYRWLEDLDSEDTASWIAAQNAITYPYLERLPKREAIQERLTQLWDHEKYGLPFNRGGTYFIYRNSGLQNHFVLYKADGLEGEPKLLLDPNTWSEDGTISLAGAVPSDDGRHLAYGVRTAGTDWSEWKVRGVTSGEELKDHLRWIKFSGASWAKDSSGFYYSRYPADEEGKLESLNYYNKLYFHRLGTEEADDILVYERADEKEWAFDGHVTEDGRFLIIHVWKGTDPRNAVFYKDLSSSDSEVVELLPRFDALYHFIANDGGTFWFKTDLDAPRSRVIAIDIARPSGDEWVEVIPEAEDVLERLGCVGDRFFAQYLKDARSVVKVFALDGAFEREVVLPGLGTAGGFIGKRSDTETFYAFTSFTAPTTIYRYEVATGETAVFRASTVDFDPAAYETKQVFVTTKDGTRVPMFVTYRKGIALDGSNPTYLTGYGGFNVSQLPVFAVTTVVWMEMGGVFASANIRGGNEYGEEWHLAGTKDRKQNVFDDFIACAEWLVGSGYTSPSRLGVGGGSNGGLLVAASMIQRPDLFGAVVCSRGVLDMIRYHKFTIGWAWVSDYGSSDEPEEFKALYAYSPLHNLGPGTHYPATLITTADHDDRVVPSHSFKFAAALQAVQGGSAPVLIRIETKAGHGLGTPTAKLIEEAADVRAFLDYQLGG